MLLISLRAKSPHMEEVHTTTIYITGLVREQYTPKIFRLGMYALERCQLQFKEVLAVLF